MCWGIIFVCSQKNDYLASANCMQMDKQLRYMTLPVFNEAVSVQGTETFG